VTKPSPAFLRLIVFAGGLISVLLVLMAFREIFLPLLLGLGFAYVFDPAVGWFECRGRSRLFGVVAIFLLAAMALAGFLLYLVPAMSEQMRHLSERLPGYAARLRASFLPWFQGIERRFPEPVAMVRSRATEAVPRVATAVSAWIAGLLGSLVRLLLLVLDLIFVPVFAFYLLVDFPALKVRMLQLVPVPYRAVTLERAREVDAAVYGFLRGQLTVAAILAVLNSIGLVALGVPLGLVIGITAGLANVIPYMSLAVGLLPAALLCWAEYQSEARVLGVVALFAGTQLLEGAFLSPRILGKSVDLHPVWVLLSIIVGGSFFGFFGMLLAVPTAAAIQVFARHWTESYFHSRLYQGDLPEEAATLAVVEPS